VQRPGIIAARLVQAVTQFIFTRLTTFSLAECYGHPN